MSNLPLAGCRVLVTRPAGQQKELIEAIEAHGGEAISLPLLSIEPIEPIENAGAKARLRRSLARLPDCDLLIFVSVNAARFGAQLIVDRGAALSPAAKLLAVGAATAREAAALLGRPVHGPATGSGSERLLELPQLEDVQGRRIAIFRAAGGRELLAQELRRRGAIVDYIEVYRRAPATAAAGRLQEILDHGPPDIAVMTSAGALARWRKLLGEIAPPSAKSPSFALPLAVNKGAGRNADRLLKMPVAAPSRRVAELAAQYGFTAVIDAGGAGAKAVVEALAAYLRRQV